jgi:hypothetical protein
MVIITGTRPYGTCDVVPELFYVATWFFHVNYVPLVPTQSNLVFGKQGDNYRVVRIPLSVKSIALAWIRTASFAGAIVCAILTLAALSDQWPQSDLLAAIAGAVFSATCFAFFMIYPRKKMPSYERACKLAQLAGLNDTGWAALNVLYGRDPFDRPVNPGETFSVR